MRPYREYVRKGRFGGNLGGEADGAGRQAFTRYMLQLRARYFLVGGAEGAMPASRLTSSLRALMSYWL
jgi:hypothetical protein